MEPADSNFNLQRAGMGGSNLPDLKEEFNDIPHVRGTCLWLDRLTRIVPTVNFLLFWSSFTSDRQHTVFGKVVEGMDNVDTIFKGDGPNGSVSNQIKLWL